MARLTRADGSISRGGGGGGGGGALTDRCASGRWLVASTVASVTRGSPAKARAASSNAGSSALECAHHGATKATAMKACARTAGSNVAAVSSRTASVFGDEEGDAPTPAQTESTTASNKRARERREGRAIVVCSVTRLDEDKVKFDAGSCEELGKASMKCLSDIGYDKDKATVVCKVHYDAYRECRKQQNEAKRKANEEYAKSFSLRNLFK